MNYILELMVAGNHSVLSFCSSLFCSVLRFFLVLNSVLVVFFLSFFRSFLSSAPAYALTARQASLGFARLVSSQSHSFFSSSRSSAIQRMIHSITTYPEMIYGVNGFCTELMKDFHGDVIGKRGAAGVYFSGLVKHHIGIAVKVDDGTMGPQYNITMNCLKYLYLNYLSKNQKLNEKERNEVELILQQLKRFEITPSINSMGIEVGVTKCNEEIFSSLNE